MSTPPRDTASTKHTSSRKSVKSKLSQKTKQMMALLLATFVDCPSLIYPSQVIEQSNQNTSKLSVLEAYKMIKWYQNFYSRAYPQSLKFYIIAGLVDHKLVNISLSTVQKSEKEGQKQMIVAPWMVYNIEALEKQYYRQNQSWKKLKQSIRQQKIDDLQKFAFKLFGQLDKKCFGYVQIQQIMTFLSQNGGKQKPIKTEECNKLVEKLCSNVVSELDLEDPEQSSILNRKVMHIENFVQLIKRIQQVDPFCGLFQCRAISLTFKTIGQKLQWLMEKENKQKFEHQYRSVKMACQKSQKNAFVDDFMSIKKSSRDFVTHQRQYSIYENFITTKKPKNHTQTYFPYPHMDHYSPQFSTKEKVKDNYLYPCDNLQFSFRTPKTTARGVQETTKNHKNTISPLNLVHKNVNITITPQIKRASKITKQQLSNKLSQIRQTNYKKSVNKAQKQKQQNLKLFKQIQEEHRNKKQEENKQNKKKQMRQKIEVQIHRIQLQRIKNKMNNYKVLF